MPNIPQFKHWPEDLVVDNTKDLIKAYDRGFAGAYKDPAADEKVIDSLKYKTWADVAHENNMYGDGEGKLSLLFTTVQKLNPQEYPGKAQRTGCCVSRSTVNAFTASYGYEVLKGIRDNDLNVAELFPKVPHPDHQTFDHVTIYGERGHKGQGAHCGTLAKAARDHTGLLPRGGYDIPDFGRYDCSKYDDNAAARSGPRHKESFRKFTNKHHVRDITQTTDIEQARDALANHYGLSVCSGFACKSTRPSITDSKGNTCAGANRWSGSWAHAMAWLGVDDRPWTHEKYGGMLFLVCNSWGSWNKGPTRIYDTDIMMPAGCFWITSKDAGRMLRGGGSYALSDIKGFPRRPLIIEYW